MDDVFEQLRKLKVKIVNVKGSHDAWPNTPDNECEFWIDYYRKYYDSKACKCAVCGKEVEKLNGGHVFKMEDLHLDTPGVYLVPLCDACNVPSNEEIMEVEDGKLFDVTGTCKFSDVKEANKEYIKNLVDKK